MSETAFALSVLSVFALCGVGFVIAGVGLEKRLRGPLLVLLVLLAGSQIAEIVRYFAPAPASDHYHYGFAFLYLAPAAAFHLVLSSIRHPAAGRGTRWLALLLYPVAAVCTLGSLALRGPEGAVLSHEAGGFVERAQGALYASRNGGLEWQEVWRSTGPEWPHSIVYADYRGTVYAAVGHLRQELRPANGSRSAVRRRHGLLKSTDGGRSWTRLEIRADGYNLTVAAIAVAPEHPDTLLAGAGPFLDPKEAQRPVDHRSAGDPSPSGIFRSTDGGETWRQVYDSGTEQTFGSFITAIGFCRDGGADRAYAAGALGVLRSDDGGRSWRRVSGGAESGWTPDGFGPAEPVALRCEKSDSGERRLVIVTYDRGIFESRDGGASWRVVSDRPSTAEFHDVAAVASGGHLVACGTSGLWYSPDGGTRWLSRSRHAEGVPPVYSAVATDPAHTGRLLAARVPFDGFLCSEDFGGSWEGPIDPHGEADVSPSPELEITDIEFAPPDSEIVYATAAEMLCKTEHEPECAGGRVLRSADGGRSWEFLPFPREGGAACFDIAVSPVDPLEVFVASGEQVYRSDDGGRQWEAVLQAPVPEEPDQPGGERYRSVAVDPTDAARVIVGTEEEGILLSQTRGATWREATIESSEAAPHDSVEEIVFDPNQDGHVYAVDFFAGGYLHSEDSGASWRRVPIEAARRPHGLAVGGARDTLYIATAGTGLYRVDDAVERLGPPVGTVYDAAFAGSVGLVTDPVGGTLARFGTDGGWTEVGLRLPDMLPDHDGPAAVAVRRDDTSRLYAGHDGVPILTHWKIDDNGRVSLSALRSLPISADTEHVVVRDIAAAPGRSHEVLVATEEVVWRGRPPAAGFGGARGALGRATAAPWKAVYHVGVLLAVAGAGLLFLRRAVGGRWPDADIAVLQASVFLTVPIVLFLDVGPLSAASVLPSPVVSLYVVLFAGFLFYALQRESVYLTDPGRIAQRLISGIRAPVLVLDFERRVIAANEGVRHAFRSDGARLYGRPFSQLVETADGIDGAQVPVAQCAAENRSIPSLCRCDAGETFNCIISFSRLKNRAQQEIGYIVSVTTSDRVGIPENRFGFTEREMDVLRLLVHGYSYRDIAARLFISLPTVKSHVHSIYEKSGARNRLQLSRLLE